MNKKYQLFINERVASIRDIQRSPSRVLQGVTRVTRGAETLGFFLSSSEFEDLLEDIEALGSNELKRRVRNARRGLRRQDTISLRDVARRYGV